MGGEGTSVLNGFTAGCIILRSTQILEKALIIMLNLEERGVAGGWGSSLSMKRQRDGAVPRGANLKQRQRRTCGLERERKEVEWICLSDLGW